MNNYPENNDPEKDKDKKKRRRRGRSSTEGLGLSGAAIISQSANSDVKGSCETGDLRAKKSKPCKTKAFNPNKRRVSKRRLVMVKKKKNPDSFFRKLFKKNEPNPIPENSSGKVNSPRWL